MEITREETYKFIWNQIQNLKFKEFYISYLWVLPNSGHSTLVIYADEFNKKAEDFLKAKYRKIEATGRFY